MAALSLCGRCSQKAARNPRQPEIPGSSQYRTARNPRQLLTSAAALRLWNRLRLDCGQLQECNARCRLPWMAQSMMMMMMMMMMMKVDEIDERLLLPEQGSRPD